ncbi:hypothetical protein RJG79_10760 [Mycoplasmatota bacterium WC44]
MSKSSLGMLRKKKRLVVGGSKRTYLKPNSIRIRDNRGELARPIYDVFKGDKDELFVEFLIIEDENLFGITVADDNSENAYKVNVDKGYRTVYCTPVIEALGKVLGYKIEKAIILNGTVEVDEETQQNYFIADYSSLIKK